MIYSFSLQSMELAVGLLLLLTHAFALARPEVTMRMAKGFPRSRSAGTVLLVVAAIWSFLLVRAIDLGEFSPLRNPMLVAIVIGSVLSWIYVPEFLAVRALGMLLLLAAEPLLESAFLKPESSRLLLVMIAYAWVIAGLFFVGMPFLLRDIISCFDHSRIRYRIGTVAGLVWGLALVIVSFV